MGKSCSSVVTADITSDAWMRSTRWLWGRPAAWAMMMAGVTHPTTMATRCCSAMEMAIPTGGIPRNWNNACWLDWIFRMVGPPSARRASRGAERSESAYQTQYTTSAPPISNIFCHSDEFFDTSVKKAGASRQKEEHAPHAPLFSVIPPPAAARPVRPAP